LEFVEDSKFPTAIPDGATLAKHPAVGKRLFQPLWIGDRSGRESEEQEFIEDGGQTIEDRFSRPGMAV
jgi:hypothetical protein